MNPNAGVDLLDRIVTYIVDPAVRVLFTAGLLFFFWGLVQFLIKLKDGQVDPEGKKHMIWGMAGMLIMVSVYGIIALVMNTIGIDFGSATDIGRIQNVNPGINFYGQ